MSSTTATTATVEPLVYGPDDVVVVNTPFQSFAFPTWEEAKARAGSATLKRGWTTAWETYAGYPNHRYFRVYNSKGRVVTGAVVFVRNRAEHAALGKGR